MEDAAAAVAADFRGEPRASEHLSPEKPPKDSCGKAVNIDAISRNRAPYQHNLFSAVCPRGAKTRILPVPGSCCDLETLTYTTLLLTQGVSCTCLDNGSKRHNGG